MIPLLYLLRCRIVNSVRRALKRPRLLIPGILLTFGVALQVVLFFSAEHGSATEMPFYTPNDLIMGKPAAFLVTMRCLLLLSVYTGFLAALGEGSSFFEPADIDFLFASPLSRRSILFFKMMGRYLSLLLPAVYLPIAFGGAYLTGLTTKLTYFIPGILGSWLFLVAVANITQVFLLRPPPDHRPEALRGETRRRTLRLMLIVAGVLSIVALFARGISFHDFFRLARQWNGDSLWNECLPDAWAADLFRTVFDGYHAEDGWRLARLALLALFSALWLFWRERDFYESAMELSVRRARITAAVQSGNVGAVLSQMAQDGRLARGRTLPDFGGGARAILWKDLVAATRIPLRHWLQLLIPAAFPAILGGVFGRENGLNVLGWTVLYSLQMPGIFLMTLRDVLRRADISKSLPISPIKLLGGELTLPLLQLTVLGWLSLGLVWLSGFWRGPLLLVAAIILPSLAALLFFVQAVFVLVYPDTNDPSQHALSGVISLSISLIALIPALILGIPLFLAGASPLQLSLAVSLVNTLGAMIALRLAAHLWQQFDPTD